MRHRGNVRVPNRFIGTNELTQQSTSWTKQTGPRKGIQLKTSVMDVHKAQCEITRISCLAKPLIVGRLEISPTASGDVLVCLAAFA